MPDDNKLHQLPGSLGQFELYSVNAYSERLPSRMKDAGGVFFPMWQREAMWVNFEQGRYKYAVRVFMGHVNAVSGRQMKEGPETQDGVDAQDYIVVPGQDWLDGICVAPGVVRQFVAMPLGSGYTVEGQKTSEEKHGGLQIEITPEMLPDLRFWSDAKQKYITLGPYRSLIDDLDESDTPEELGYKVGDVLRSYPTDEAYHEPFRVRDFVMSKTGETDEKSTSEDVVVLDAIYRRLPTSSKPVGMAPIRDSSGATFSDYLKSANLFSDGDGYGDSGAVRFGVAPPALEHYRCSSPERSSMDQIMAGQAQAPDESYETEEQTREAEESTNTDEKAEFETKDIKAMGLAAGGKLIQDIYKDPYPASTWNHAAARILNVHMLDPDSFEKVTHIVPRPPPIDVSEYVEAGGEFYVVDEKIDERLDGGDFDNVKSVSHMDQQVGITTDPEFDPAKPKMCSTCEVRLCDCIVRPCNHQFCNMCIKQLAQKKGEGAEASAQQQGHWTCPRCDSAVAHVAGFSAPMNLPGEEPLRTRVAVHVLKIEDGRLRFSSIQKSRI
ncbi:uncharacterized protein SETTUDRAFT_134260 [Exserohilum turcica Et28A]|uniref:RING-type domain-containing protein n=1 Tax=Exserohilum turcicum (strain 28A) TaxID=671987 RepID=R0KWV5_EXST2|nr:uncharacterized protein SETTUDRAFT_134260 [Exserohilum turcica Et28A]EOA92167.1 hypothetical protein SETTUDRAFT_134260 [Exserohilum turcica Et28A]